jgi:hypothetical protein
MDFDINSLSIDIDRFTLLVGFNDGLKGKVIINPTWLSGVFTPLKDKKLFAQAFIHDGAVTWRLEKGYVLDLAPDTMHEEIKKNNGVYILK